MTDLGYYELVWELEEPTLLARTPTSTLYKVSWNGCPAVLKMLSPRGLRDEEAGVIALEWFEGEGAALLYRRDHESHLMEYMDGEDLKAMVLRGDDEKATLILADILNQLHRPRNSAVPRRLTRLARRFASLFNQADQDESKGVDSIYVRASAIADWLLDNPRDECVLHGDLHHENVLFSSISGWLAIDPKGLYGERTYDAANILCNPVGMDDLVADETRLLRNANLLASAAKFEIDRLLAFTFAHACLSACWSEEDGANPDLALRVAAIVEPHLGEFGG